MIYKGHYFTVAALFLGGILYACADGGDGPVRSSITSDGGDGGSGAVPTHDRTTRTHLPIRGATANSGSIYCDDLEGLIDGGSVVTRGDTKTFRVLGIAVSVDAVNTAFNKGATYAGLVDGTGIEVTGYYDGDVLKATRVQPHNDSHYDYELQGTMIQFDGFTVTLKLRNGARAGAYAVSSVAHVDLLPYPFGRFVRIKLARFGDALQVVHVQSDDAYYIKLRGNPPRNETDRMDTRISHRTTRDNGTRDGIEVESHC